MKLQPICFVTSEQVFDTCMYISGHYNLFGLYFYTCTADREYRTFCTKEFSHKSFSTSFGTFTQFLVVILHNNYK